jgi:hypothetical protein
VTKEIPEFTAAEIDEDRILTDMMLLRDRMIRLMGSERSPRARYIATAITELEGSIGRYGTFVVGGGIDATWLQAATGEANAAES